MMGWFGRSPNGSHGNPDGSRSSSPSPGYQGTYNLSTLQSLYGVLSKNQECTSQNQEALIETVRSISEVIVYGDQHAEQDGLLFDYFCEKNMFVLLLGLLDQSNCGTRLKIQIIQSVSILVQNIRSEISLYYTLSNNHVNRLITHPFNFGNEEVLGHYISFLKTLSLKLNLKTIQFFFNDRLNTFPLYEEAVKFFDHPEGMVRTAVRAITLNVYKVEDDAMRSFLLYGSSANYIEQVVRFIHQRCRRLHLLLVRASLVGNPNATDELTSRQLDSLLLKLEVALTEQQDHLLYLEDILHLNVPGLKDIVVDSAMAYLFLPLLIASLLPQTFPFNELDDLGEKDFVEAGLERKQVTDMDTAPSGSLLSLFLLAHACFSFSSPRMINRLTETMFLAPDDPEEPEEEVNNVVDDAAFSLEYDEEEDNEDDETDGASSLLSAKNAGGRGSSHAMGRANSRDSTGAASRGNPIRDALFKYLEHTDERHCLGVVCVIYAVVNNKNIDPDLLTQIGFTPYRQYQYEEECEQTVAEVIDELIDSAVSGSCDAGSTLGKADHDSSVCASPSYPKKVVKPLLNLLMREPPPCTLTQRVVAKLVIDLCFFEGGEGPCLLPEHADLLDRGYMLAVQRFETQLVSEETKQNPARFVEMFEGEWVSLCEGPLVVESLMTKPEILMPINTPERAVLPLDSRQPFSMLENTRFVIRSFMIMRLLWVALNRKSNALLASVGCSVVSRKENQRIELGQSNYIKVSVMNPRGGVTAIQPAFMVVADGELILAEPEKSGIGKGITRTVAPLQRVVFYEGHNDPLVMYLVVKSPPPVAIGWAHRQLNPLTSSKAKLTFDGLDDTPSAEPKQYPWNVGGRTNNFSHHHQDLRDIPSWHLTIRFDDLASAYWAREQLQQAIDQSIQTKLRRISRLLQREEHDIKD